MVVTGFFRYENLSVVDFPMFREIIVLFSCDLNYVNVLINDSGSVWSFHFGPRILFYRKQLPKLDLLLTYLIDNVRGKMLFLTLSFCNSFNGFH